MWQAFLFTARCHVTHFSAGCFVAEEIEVASQSNGRFSQIHGRILGDQQSLLVLTATLV